VCVCVCVCAIQHSGQPVSVALKLLQPVKPPGTATVSQLQMYQVCHDFQQLLNTASLGFDLLQQNVTRLCCELGAACSDVE